MKILGIEPASEYSVIFKKKLKMYTYNYFTQFDNTAIQGSKNGKKAQLRKDD